METSEMRLRIYARRPATLVLLASLFGIGTGISIPAISAESREAPLVAATKASDTEAVEALLAQQIDVDATEPDGTTALHWAAYQGDAEIAAVLLRAGASATAPNRYGVTPLTLAAGRGDTEVVRA